MLVKGAVLYRVGRVHDVGRDEGVSERKGKGKGKVWFGERVFYGGG